MARQNVPLVSIGNRGLISPKALARVDLDRTRYSAEVFKNWIGKTQGALTIRPGTKYFGSSLNDTGAQFIEFVASTSDVALAELTHNKMRIWLGTDAHALSLLERPSVSTTVTLSDTGWDDNSTGGVPAPTGADPEDILPTMTAATTNSVTISAESEFAASRAAWKVADDNTATDWRSGFVDSSSYSHTTTAVGKTYLSTMTKKVGSSAVWFTNDAAQIQLNSASQFAMGTGDFVIEAYIYPNLLFTCIVYDGGGATSGTGIGSIFASVFTTNSKLVYKQGGSVRITGTTTVTIGTWHHVALVRSSGTTRLFLNGVQEGADYADSTDYTVPGTTYPIIGPVVGYVDEVRVSKGVTRGYFSGFTPSTAAHPDTGESTSLMLHFEDALPIWLQIDLGSAVAVTGYSLRAPGNASELGLAPKTFTLQHNDVDTGTGWTTVHSKSAETGWATSEKRTYTRLDADTGTVETRRYWRLNVTAVNSLFEMVALSEIELFLATAPAHIKAVVGGVRLNALTIGGLAKYQKQVVVDTGDANVEHALNIDVTRGPVTLRCGSTSGAEDYIAETSLGSGNHNLAFTPVGNFHVTLQSDQPYDRVVNSLTISDTGTVEITTPWASSNLDDVRTDQSADVVYVDCNTISPRKIERRGTGRSWSLVAYSPNDGPFLPVASSSAILSISQQYGNATMTSDIPFFKATHVGALMRMFHEGQSGEWLLGAQNTKTDEIEVNGLADTGTNNDNERRIIFSVSGTWAGTAAIERSIDGDTLGFKAIPKNYKAAPAGTDTGTLSDTGTFSYTIDDPDDNLTVFYRLRLTSYTSGVAQVNITYPQGGITGIARITGYNTSTSVDVEVLSRFSDTGGTDNWQQGEFSAVRGYPTAVALHGGRLCHAKGGSIYMSVSDDYESFDETVDGDAAPLSKTLGSGPVDNIYYMVSLLRLIIGTAGSEMTLRSSSLDEPVTPSNASIGAFSTQGSANLRAVKMDNRAIFVQKSKQRVFMVGAGTGGGSTFGDFEGLELTLLVPDLMASGVVSVAIQRQPDTRIHCVLANGTVAILTYEPTEEVIAWTLWETDGTVEKAMVLPGIQEDAVYYHINRTINGVTKRYLEKWAMERECIGDTGLSWLADCAISMTADTGRSDAIEAPHLGGEAVIVWANDTGSGKGKDLSYDTGGVQKTYTLDTGGSGTLLESVRHRVIGLPYTADWKSTKLAYAAEAGSAMTQMKRVAQVGLILHETHNNGLFYGADSGNLDPLPREYQGTFVDKDKIHYQFDEVAVSMDSTNNPDSRLHLRAKAPRPATVLAVVPSVQTNERV